MSDINVVAGVLKLYFRLLPIPLITTECFHKILESNSKYNMLNFLPIWNKFVCKSSKTCNIVHILLKCCIIVCQTELTDPDARISHIKESLNCLPPAHQATLSDFILHLSR